MPKPQRLDVLDALRGLAVLWMTAFHLGFDLAWLRFWQQDFYRDPFWTVQRTLIVSLFLLCAGAGQALAVQQGQSWRRFWRRWAQVAAAAALVTVGSWLVFPRSFIYVGVLHGMAVMLVLVRLTAHWAPWRLWVLGGAVVASKFVAEYALIHWAAPELARFMSQPGPNVLGWIAHKPVTEDYVPLAPWLGVMWWGAAAVRQWPGLWRRWAQGGAPVHPLAPVLLFLGRHSLPYYLVHQPVLLGVLGFWRWAVG